MPEATAQKKFSCRACGTAAEWNSARQVFDNPKGIASSSPGLPSLRGYPGKPFPNGLQPQRGCINTEQVATTPLGLVSLFGRDPRVARSSQPWADRVNPFGIHANCNVTNPNGIGIIQPSVAAQRLRWVIAQNIHQL